VGRCDAEEFAGYRVLKTLRQHDHAGNDKRYFSTLKDLKQIKIVAVTATFNLCLQFSDASIFATSAIGFVAEIAVLPVARHAAAVARWEDAYLGSFYWAVVRVVAPPNTARIFASKVV
jgi:hypothetical protein